MIKYKVNINFKENGKTLNELITDVLKIELQKRLDMTCDYFNKELPCNHTYYSQIEGSSN